MKFHAILACALMLGVCICSSASAAKIRMSSDAAETDYAKERIVNEFRQKTRQRRTKLGGDPILPSLDVFVVPHSHMDVGWIETADGYYKDKVKHIYDGIVDQLSQDSAKRFLSVEMYFVWRWFTDPATSETQKAQFKALVQSGQIEIVNGGFVMHDGAITEWQSDINQMTLGHAFATSTFGDKGRANIGYHIDPFGASAVTPTHMAMMGFNVYLFNRINYLDKEAMEADRGLEFMWRGSPSLGASEQCFAHDQGKFSYGPDCGPLCFDDPKSVPVTEVTEFILAVDFAYHIERIAHWHKTKNVMFLWGNDFQFTNATKMFENMDKLMAYMNRHHEIFDMNLHYGSLTEYFSAVHDANVTWPVRGAQDFFPLKSAEHDYWTGFYTSRPHLKGVARLGDHVQRPAETLFSAARALDPPTGTTKGANDLPALYEDIEVLRRACGCVNHHDGITGTEEPAVVDDYLRMLWEGVDTAQHSTEICAGQLAKQDKTSAAPVLSHDPAAVQSIKPGESVPVVVHNTLGWSQDTFMSIDVNTDDLSVTDDKGVTVQAQVSPSFNSSGPKYTLYFRVRVPPLGLVTYFVTAGSTSHKGTAYTSRVKHVEPHATPSGRDPVVIENGYMALELNADTGLVTELTLKGRNTTIPFGIELLEYHSYTGAGPNGGAYSFRPDGSASPVSASAETTVITGPYVQAVRQQFSSAYVQVLRLYNVDDSEDITGFIDVQQTVGPMGENREAITRLTSNLATHGVFYTDNNGIEMRKRVYNASSDEPVAGNYYPLVSMMYVQDDEQDLQMSLLSRRSHGASSVGDGQLEAMVHRRVMTSDHKGPAPLDDQDILKDVRFRVIVDGVVAARRRRHAHVYYHQFPPTMLFGAAVMDPASYIDKYRTQRALMTADLPMNVHLVTFAPIDATSQTVLFRLAHIYEAGEDTELSKNASVPLDSFFTELTVTAAEERSLTAMWKLDEMHRWHWKTESDDTHKGEGVKHPTGTPLSAGVGLGPMQIRTFYLEVE